MSLTSLGTHKSRNEVERELGLSPALSDTSKPLLLTLIEQFKYPGAQNNNNPFENRNSNPWPSAPSAEQQPYE